MTVCSPIFETDHIVLRPFTENDLEDVFRALSHPDVIRYYGVNYHSLEATKEQLAWFADLENTGTGIWRAIVSSDRETFYGAAGLSNLLPEHKKAEIGFWLLPNYWGQGLMSEALPLIYRYGFGQLGLHRIEGFVEIENANCKRFLSKLDFRYEGTMRDCEIKNGAFISLDIYAKLREV